MIRRMSGHVRRRSRDGARDLAAILAAAGRQDGANGKDERWIVSSVLVD